jgi:hypothetical protein
MHAREMDSIGQGRKTCDEQVERLVKIFSPGVNGFRVVVVINCWIIPLIPSVFPTPLPRIILILAAMATAIGPHKVFLMLLYIDSTRLATSSRQVYKGYN